MIEDEQNSSYTLSARDAEEAFSAETHYAEQQSQGLGMSFVEENYLPKTSF